MPPTGSLKIDNIKTYKNSLSGKVGSVQCTGIGSCSGMSPNVLQLINHKNHYYHNYWVWMLAKSFNDLITNYHYMLNNSDNHMVAYGMYSEILFPCDYKCDIMVVSYQKGCFFSSTIDRVVSKTS